MAKRDRGIENPGLAAAMRALRFSSAASRHTTKPRRGTRAQREREAIRAQRRDES